MNGLPPWPGGGDAPPGRGGLPGLLAEMPGGDYAGQRHPYYFARGPRPLLPATSPQTLQEQPFVNDVSGSAPYMRTWLRHRSTGSGAGILRLILRIGGGAFLRTARICLWPDSELLFDVQAGSLRIDYLDMLAPTATALPGVIDYAISPSRFLIPSLLPNLAWRAANVTNVGPTPFAALAAAPLSIQPYTEAVQVAVDSQSGGVGIPTVRLFATRRTEFAAFAGIGSWELASTTPAAVTAGSISDRELVQGLLLGAPGYSVSGLTAPNVCTVSVYEWLRLA